MMRAVLTFDLHDSDRPEDIEQCAVLLWERGIPATFFVPTMMLQQRYDVALRRVATLGFELGTHSHRHDRAEMQALGDAGDTDLGFLEDSTRAFVAFFGFQPLVFRSPAWCGLGRPAVLELDRLGYLVDSSATPQRPGLLSSMPWKNPWLLTPRSPHWLTPRLLEVPTTTFLVPLGSPTFQTLRGASKALFMIQRLEATVFRNRVLVLQLHVGDLVGLPMLPGKDGSWRDLLPSREGGIRARKWLRMRDSDAIHRLSFAMLESARRHELTTLAALHHSAATGADGPNG